MCKIVAGVVCRSRASYALAYRIWDKCNDRRGRGSTFWPTLFLTDGVPQRFVLYRQHCYVVPGIMPKSRDCSSGCPFIFVLLKKRGFGWDIELLNIGASENYRCTPTVACVLGKKLSASIFSSSQGRTHTTTMAALAISRACYSKSTA